jgi:hypothetical protein
MTLQPPGTTTPLKRTDKMKRIRERLPPVLSLLLWRAVTATTLAAVTTPTDPPGRRAAEVFAQAWSLAHVLRRPGTTSLRRSATRIPPRTEHRVLPLQTRQSRRRHVLVGCLSKPVKKAPFVRIVHLDNADLGVLLEVEGRLVPVIHLLLSCTPHGHVFTTVRTVLLR